MVSVASVVSFSCETLKGGKSVFIIHWNRWKFPLGFD